MRSLAVIESSLRLLAARHFRDSSTESKVLVLVSINQLKWVYDTHGLVSPQRNSNAQPPPGFSRWDAFAPCKLCFGLFQRGDNFPIFAYCELSDRQKRFGCISNDRQLLGICLAQMLKNFECAHELKLPRAPPARNSFHGRHNSLVLALRRDPSWTTAQFD